jgi:hypothetical protein
MRGRGRKRLVIYGLIDLFVRDLPSHPNPEAQSLVWPGLLGYG